MTVFASKFLDGHIVVTINRLDYIVDTGSPTSFGDGQSIRINEKQFPISERAFGGLTAKSLNALSGLQVDGLIGMDILHHFNIRFTRNETTFADTSFEYAPTAITLPVVDTTTTVPIVILNIGRADRRIFFDTGAKLSYLSDDLLAGESIGERDDFHPSIGVFKTKVYRIDVTMNRTVETLTFGALPSALRPLLTMGKTEGILGTELLDRYSITLSNSDRTLVFEPLN